MVFLSLLSSSFSWLVELILVYQLLLNDIVYKFLKYSTKVACTELILFNSDICLRTFSRSMVVSPLISVNVCTVWCIKVGYPSKYGFT